MTTNTIAKDGVRILILLLGHLAGGAGRVVNVPVPSSPE